MAETIKWNFVTQVIKGPNLSAAGSIDDVDAYDKFDIALASGATQIVNLVPSDSIKLLIINPKNPDLDLSYDLSGNSIPLDGPHVLIGTGAVSLLGGATSLTFTNGSSADAVIEILVGRDATP